MATPNVIITGATGFLGGRLTSYLAEQGQAETLTVTGRNPAKADHFRTLGTRFLPGDLRNETFVQTLCDGATAIVHCAALSSAWGPYRTFYEHNMLTTKHLTRAAIENKVGRFVYISSPSIYATLSDRLMVREDDPLPRRFLNHYARTKFEAEELVKTELSRADIPFVILRPRALIGAGDTVIMPRLIEANRVGRLRVIGNGQNLADLTGVSNVTRAIELALTADGDALNRTYNITNGEPVLLWEQIEQVFSDLGMTFSRKFLPYSVALLLGSLLEKLPQRPGHEPALTRYTVSVLAHSMTLNISNARQYLGYEPTQTTADGLREFVEWCKTR